MTVKTQGLFTKLIVDDEEKMAAYYCNVYGLKVWQRVSGDTGGAGEPFREVILTMDGPQASGGTLVLFNFINRPKPRDQQVILGFLVDDLDAVCERIVANGGILLGTIRDMPEHGIRVIFSEDGQGGLCENVELVKA